MTDNPRSVRPPDHVDADGPWWACEPYPEWWLRHTPDGSIQARHRGGRLADVMVPATADRPGYLLDALTYSRKVVGNRYVAARRMVDAGE